MSHEWHAGVLTTSSWHGLEDIGTLQTAEDTIAAGERSGAWPVDVRFDNLRTTEGLVAPGRAVVGTYANAFQTVLGLVGGTYRATAPAEWRDLVTAAVAAGAQPTGAFALRGGSRVLATFDVGGNGVRTQLVLADSFDGSLKLTAGTTCIRVVCANTLSAAMSSDGAGMAGLKHTASLETKINALREAIGETIATGEKVRDTYHAAEGIRLDGENARKAFNLLFPPAAEGASKSATTRADNVRADARAAARLAVNVAGPAGTLANLWNAATWLVDRNVDGSTRDARGGADALDSMLFGARAARVQEIQATIEAILTDGTIAHLTVDAARSHGIDDRQIGRAMLESMIGD